GETVSRATYGAGFGSSSRAYEASDVHLGMTPATYKRGGSGTEIRYRVLPCRYGRLLVAATDRGVCTVALGDGAAALEAQLKLEFPKASLVRSPSDSDDFGRWIDAIVAFVEGAASDASVPVDVRATAFQRRVWRALQQIPMGETRSYAEVAKAIG